MQVAPGITCSKHLATFMLHVVTWLDFLRLRASRAKSSSPLLSASSARLYQSSCTAPQLVNQQDISMHEHVLSAPQATPLHETRQVTPRPHRGRLRLVKLVLQPLLRCNDLRAGLPHLDQIGLHVRHCLVQYFLGVLNRAHCIQFSTGISTSLPKYRGMSITCAQLMS